MDEPLSGGPRTPSHVRGLDAARPLFRPDGVPRIVDRSDPAAHPRRRRHARPSRGHAAERTSIGVFAPNDAYFTCVVEDAIYAARPGATGRAAARERQRGLRVRDGSLIVFPPGEPNGQWIDTSGAQQLSVAGFAPYTPTPPRGCSTSRARALRPRRDRTVTALQPVPPGTQPDEIAAVVGDKLTMLRGESGDEREPRRRRRRYRRQLHAGRARHGSPVPQGLQVVPAGAAARAGLPRRLRGSSSRTPYETVPASGSGFTSYELSEDLWIVTDAAGNAAAQTDSDPARHHQPGRGGRPHVRAVRKTRSSVLYVDEDDGARDRRRERDRSRARVELPGDGPRPPLRHASCVVF